jgi:hypothetical protein
VTTCVFVGPTVPIPHARSVLDAVYLPPVRQGDVYRAVVRHRPRAVGIIDGYFQQVPSVWHKEILWAMAQGVHVFGSASMGALRAAELASFGMRGVGMVFEAYRDGRLTPYLDEPFEDDDEVAVMHGAAETGFAPLSEAMVNIRCTLASAVEASLITPATRDTLARLGKELFYPDRSYRRLLALGGQRGLPMTELDALDAWLVTGGVNQKRADALDMLTTMREFIASDPGPARVDYVFEASAMWNRAARDFASLGPEPEALLEELRLDGAAYIECRRVGLLRMAALRECERQGLAPSDEARRKATATLRRRLGLLGGGTFERWLEDSDLTPAAFARLVDEEAKLEELEALGRPQSEAHLLDDLRVRGEYARYAALARAKQRTLATSGLQEHEPDNRTKLQVTLWYFEKRLGLPVPEDISRYAADVGFPDIESFYRALWREWIHGTRGDRPDGAHPQSTQL